MPLPSSISVIISETHGSFWHLPDIVRERERKERNAYMREYMRAYRRDSPSLNVSLSSEQRRRLDADALAAGHSPTAFFRKAAFAYLDRHNLLPKSLEAAIAKATVEISRVGNSINQIAHHANIARHASHRELQRANGMLEELQKTVDRIIPSSPPGYDR